MKVNCLNCDIEFDKTEVEIKRYPKNFCNRICSWNFIKKNFINSYIITNCKNCLIEIKRVKSQTNRSKTSNLFCSHSCSAIFNNKNFPRHCLRSKAEELLSSLIKSNFPNLKIIKNDRTLLESGLEIDILIPELKLAIEINGPTHYEPIYGNNNLLKVMNSDKRKQQELKNKNYKLIIVDVSKQKSKNNSDIYIKKEFEKYIKPTINENKS